MSIAAVGSPLVAAANQVYQTTARAGAGSVERSESDEAVAADTVTLSSEAEKTLQLSGLFGTEPGEVITLADIRSYGAEQLQEFGKGFRALMRGNGIDTSEPITLGHEPGTGRVIVINNHPEADQIEALLAENPALCNTYTGATSALALARHGEEHAKFAEAYAQNPQAAVVRYAYLFNTRWEASVTFSQDGDQVQYDRVPR